jgi:hypothetical protein
MAASQAIDDPDARPVILTSEPVEDGFRRSDSALVTGRDLELDKGREAPERPRPLAVGVHTETTFSLLPGEQSAYFGALNDPILIVLRFFIEQLALRDDTNGRLVRCEEPLD